MESDFLSLKAIKGSRPCGFTISSPSKLKPRSPLLFHIHLSLSGKEEAPFIFHVLWLWIRYSSLTLPSTCSPATITIYHWINRKRYQCAVEGSLNVFRPKDCWEVPVMVLEDFLPQMISYLSQEEKTEVVNCRKDVLSTEHSLQHIVRAIHESFREMHGRDFGDRVISVTELKCECVAHT